MTDATTKIPPLFTCIGTGDLSNTTQSSVNNTINIDLFNGEKVTDLPIVSYNGSKFTVNKVTKKSKSFDLNGYMKGNTLKLNGSDVTNPIVVGTHIKTNTIPESYLTKEQTANMGEYNTQAKLDFVYVGVSAGVTEDFGNNDKQYLKTFDYNVDPKTIKDSTKDKIKIGYYHYLTGYPPTNGKSPEEIGKNQANKFLEKLGYDKDGKLKDSKILDGTLIPMVIFNDNITQKNYYGGSPRGVKENLNNF